MNYRDDQGRPSPRGNDAFPPVSYFPQFPKYFSGSVENFAILPSSKQLGFHPQKSLFSR